MPNIVNGSVVQLRSALSHNVSAEYEFDPIQTALVLLMLGVNPEYFENWIENWKNKSRALFKFFPMPSEKSTVSLAY